MSQRSVPPGDRLEAAGDELYALYREGATSEPDALLDQRILAAARAELTAHPAKPSRGRAPWWKAWLKPASVMAVAALGLSLTWQVIDQQERDRRQEIGDARDQPKALDRSGPDAAAPPPRLAAPANKPQAPAVNERAPAARPAPAPPPAAIGPRAFPAQEESAKRKDGAVSGLVAPSGPAPLPAAPAEKKNQSSDARDARAKKDDGDARSDAAAPASATAKLEAARRAETSAAGANALEKSAVEAATPQAWLQQIRELRAAGHEAEAAQSLARFRARFPDFALPDDLKALK